MLQPRVLNLNEVVTGVEQMLRRLIGEDIELTVSLKSDIGPVKADPGQVEQVIMNLAVNARDAMPSGGKLTIETSNNELGREYTRRHPEARPGPYVMLAVSDTGIGMNKEIESHLFEPFFTTKDHGKGTGLGLSTVYGIIKQSNGHIGVYSEPGKGSTFKVYLPRSDDSPEHRKLGEKPTGNLKGSETILLTEDEDMLRELAKRVLIRNGYTVLEASHGAEAIKISEQHPDTIHMLITDVVMPGGIGGRELGEKLVSLRPDMEVLYISGYTDSAIVKNGMLDPDISFLQKPFTPDVLTRKVREILDSSSR
jgi:CheY-like chemotaxis protein